VITQDRITPELLFDPEEAVNQRIILLSRSKPVSRCRLGLAMTAALAG